MIYLDSAATTPMLDAVFDAMVPWMKENYGNAGSTYQMGRRAKSAITIAREQVARLMNANADNILFTSGGTEGNNFAIKSAAERLKGTGKNHIIVSSVEHDSVLRAAESLEGQGFEVTYLPVCKDGYVELETLENSITQNTGFISIMFVNNETGAVNSVCEIGQLAQRKGILFHTDCVQAAGFLPIDIQEIGCDYATISAHKFHGPKGVGCVFVKDLAKCSPLIHGGHAQEFGLRGGTENVASIVGVGIAAQIALDTIKKNQELLSRYRSLFLERIKGALEETIWVNGEQSSPSRILNVGIDGVDADTFVMMMDVSGVCISAGSACRSHELEPSGTLLAMGLSPDKARNSVRISFSDNNSEKDVHIGADRFIQCVKTLRGGLYDFKERT